MCIRDSVHAHPRKQLKVFGVRVVEIYTKTLGIAALGVCQRKRDIFGRSLLVRLLPGIPLILHAKNIRDARTLPVFLPCALALIGGEGAAPEESVWEPRRRSMSHRVHPYPRSWPLVAITWRYQ